MFFVAKSTILHHGIKLHQLDEEALVTLANLESNITRWGSQSCSRYIHQRKSKSSSETGFENYRYWYKYNFFRAATTIIYVTKVLRSLHSWCWPLGALYLKCNDSNKILNKICRHPRNNLQEYIQEAPANLRTLFGGLH